VHDFVPNATSQKWNDVDETSANQTLHFVRSPVEDDCKAGLKRSQGKYIYHTPFILPPYHARHKTSVQHLDDLSALA
jgi:hypothetical protein